MANYYEECIRLFPEPKTVSNWMMGELLRELKKDEREIDQCPVTPQHLAEMLKMMKEGTISGKIAKDVFEEMYRTGDRPEKIVKEKGWTQILDGGEIERNHPKGDGEQSETGGGLSKGEGETLWFLRGRSDEGDQREGQPQAGE